MPIFKTHYHANYDPVFFADIEVGFFGYIIFRVLLNLKFQVKFDSLGIGIMDRYNLSIFKYMRVFSRK